MNVTIGSIVPLPTRPDRSFEVIATKSQHHTMVDKGTVSVPEGCDYVLRYMHQEGDGFLPYVCAKEQDEQLVECFGKEAIVKMGLPH